MESSEPLSSTKVALRNFFGLPNAQNSLMHARPVSGGFTNILKPSVVGNAKLQDNFQNVRRNETDNRNSNFILGEKSEKGDGELCLGAQS